jgi:hypothetical protein
MLVALLGLAIAVMWPWRAANALSGASLARYAPSYDGWSTLRLELSPAGKSQRWQSTNHKHLRHAEAYATLLNKAQRDSILHLYTQDPPDVLLTVAAVNWAVTGHDLAAVGRLTGDMAMTGMMRFGKPMLYAVLIAALVRPGALVETELLKGEET